MLTPKYTKLAIEDMRQVFAHIAGDNPQSAGTVINRIERGIDTLCVHPHLGRPGRLRGTRELLIARTPFIVVYRPYRSILWVLSILHTARKYPPLS